MVSRQEARTYLKQRGVLANAMDIVELADAFTRTRDIYVGSDAHCLLMMQDFGSPQATISADTLEGLEEVLRHLSLSDGLTFRTNQQSIAGALHERVGVSVYWENYHYAYSGAARSLRQARSARALAGEDLPAARRCAERRGALPEGHPGRIDYALSAQVGGERTQVFGQVEGGELVSCVRLEAMDLSDVDADVVWDVADIWTDGRKRGQGLAADTLLASTAWLLERGKVPYYSGVKSDNVASQRTCQSVGFERVCESIFLR